MDVCLRVLKESNESRFESYSVRNSELIVSHITFRDCRVRIFSDNLSRNSCIYGYSICFYFMVRIAPQANAHQRTATSEAQEDSRKILKTRQKPCLVSQRNHRLQKILHKQPFQQLFYRATAENIVQLLTAPN